MHLPFCYRIWLLLSFPVGIPQLLTAPVQHDNPGKGAGWKWLAICILFLYISYLAKPINPKAPWLENVLNVSVSKERILHHTTNVQPNSRTELASPAPAGCLALAVISRPDSNSLCHSFIYYVSSHPVHLLICFAALNFTSCLYVPPFKPAVNFWADWTLAGR